MAKNESYGNDVEDLVFALLASVKQIDSTDRAFGARLDQVMKFNGVLTTFERKIDTLIKDNTTKLEKATERLNGSKQNIVVLETHIKEIKESLRQHREYITRTITTIESDTKNIKDKQETLERIFGELQNKVSKENRFYRIAIWAYRSILAIALIGISYYGFTLNSQVIKLNEKLNAQSKNINEIKGLETQTIETIENSKPKSSKK